MVGITSLNGDDWSIVGVIPQVWAVHRPGSEFDPGAFDPPIGPWTPATVPGHVQRDLETAGQIPDYRLALNSRACEWTSSRDWIYRKDFSWCRQSPESTVHLVFDGVDYECRVWLNGGLVGSHVGTCDPFVIDVTMAVREGGNRLVVVVLQPPTEPEAGGGACRSSEIRHWKPRFAYGWDWAPRLVPVGIWGGVRLVEFTRLRIVDLVARPTREEGNGGGWLIEVVVTVDVTTACRLPILSQVQVRGGRLLASAELLADLIPGTQTVVTHLRVNQPELWEVNGFGHPSMHEVVVEIGERSVLDDVATVPLGFRVVNFVAQQAGSCAYSLVVNGQPVPIRGWNWVPVDQYYGGDLEKQYSHAIELARRAGANMLRVWGGGILESEYFYNLCDEAGILVWQEFLQSSSGIDNRPPEDDAYLLYASRLAHSMIVQRRNHPSLALWCGGNELLDDDDIPLDEGSHRAIACLKAQVERDDPGRYYLPASPSGPVFIATASSTDLHDVHGPWRHQGLAKHYPFWDSLAPLLHSEFGVEGAANIHVLRRLMPESALWPPDHTNAHWMHRGNCWLHRSLVESAFGAMDDIESFVAASQWLQADGLRYAVEASRRRFPRTAGTLPWQFNEAFPNASCTNVLDHYGYTKPAYWLVARAYARDWIGCAMDSPILPDRTFRASIWIESRYPGVSASWTLGCVSRPTPVARGELCRELAPTGHVTCIGEIDVNLDIGEDNVYVLELSLSDQFGSLIASNEYLVSTRVNAPFAPLLESSQGPVQRDMQVSRDSHGKITIWNTSNEPRFAVGVRPDRDHSGPYLSDGYRAVLLPGAQWTVMSDGPGPLLLTALGLSDQVLPGGER